MNQGKGKKPRIKGLEHLLDVPVTVTVELGATRVLIQDILALGNGSVVELDRLAGEPLDIKVNGKLIARGVSVTVNGRLAVRVTEIVGEDEAGRDPLERSA